jgi:hypothetical protein
VFAYRSIETGHYPDRVIDRWRAALAAGRQVFVISPYEWTFGNHPRCRVFSSLDAAIAAIMAMQQGERAREAAMGGRLIKSRPIGGHWAMFA